MGTFLITSPSSVVIIFGSDALAERARRLILIIRCTMVYEMNERKGATQMDSVNFILSKTSDYGGRF